MKIIESPREAFQAYHTSISTEWKVRYINALMKVGFDTVEVGSIVSPKVIPQLSDTMDVIKNLDFRGNRSKLMVLMVNKKGAQQISEIDEITDICYPFPISGSFAKRNLNSTIDNCLETIDEIRHISIKANKNFIVYVSMAFGNPYGDDWSLDILSERVEMLVNKGFRFIPLSNVSVEVDEKKIAEVFSRLVTQFPEIEFGLHLHSNNQNWFEKIDAAYSAGCRRFDGVIHGMGGCPITGKDPLANLATENLLQFLKTKNIIPAGFDDIAFIEASKLASEIFTKPESISRLG